MACRLLSLFFTCASPSISCSEPPITYRVVQFRPVRPPGQVKELNGTVRLKATDRKKRESAREPPRHNAAAGCRFSQPDAAQRRAAGKADTTRRDRLQKRKGAHQGR